MRVAIVGGGISGLAAAHRLLELSREQDRPIDVRLFEASDRLGGVIETTRRDGFILESGPDSFITDKPWALALCRRIGLDGRLIGTNNASRRSFVVHNDRLHPVPEGFQLLAPSRLGPFLASGLFSWPGKLRMAMEPFVPPRRGDGDESLADFVTRRLGREALARIAQPMVAGIYGADPALLSLDATLPRFRTMEREHGSLIRAMWARSGQTRRQGDKGTSGARYGLFVSFDEGMQVLVDALVDRLPAEWIARGTRVTALARGEGGWRVSLTSPPDPLSDAERGSRSSFDAVCLALPAHASAALVRGVDAPLAEALRAIPYASAATVNLAYARDDVPHPMDGFGFVVPSSAEYQILGCTFSGVKFLGRAPEGSALLRAFLGGGPDAGERDGETAKGRDGEAAAWYSMDDAGVVAAVRADLQRLLGLSAEPRFTTIHRHAASMAQYAVGHRDRVAAIDERVAAIPGLALAGNGYEGIGIPDCIHAGERAAERLWER